MKRHSWLKRCSLPILVAMSVAVVFVAASGPAGALGPDLSVQLSGPSTGNLPNGQLTYSITVQNTGTQSATGVVLTDQLPSTLAFVSAASLVPCSASAGTVQCSIGTLGPGASVQLTLTMGPGTVSGTTGDTMTVTNTVNVTPADSTPSDNSATVQTVVTLNPVSQGPGPGPSNSPGAVPPVPVKVNPSFTG